MQTLDSYMIPVVNNTWRVKGVHGVFGDITCWNCGKPGHDLCLCPEPRNQDCIDKARAAFRKSKNSQNLKPGGTGGGGSEYTQGKLQFSHKGRR
jgi:hypothetical protein